MSRRGHACGLCCAPMANPSLDRRTFLRLTGAALLLPAVACEPPDEETAVEPFPQVPESKAVFPMGVQAGSADETGAVFWGFTTGTDAILRIWPADAPDDAQPDVERSVSAIDGYLKLRINDLPAGKSWRYAWFDDERGARSPFGHVRTAFAAGVLGTVRLGATACTSNGRAPFTPLPRLAARDLDAFCHLGDMSYNDSAATLADYREAWRENLTNAQYRALLTSCGGYRTWDDHEIADSDDLDDLPASRREAARQAFFETLPSASGDRVWASYRWGASVEIFVVDTRHERDDDHLMSRVQLTWLKDALADSPCRFKVVLTSVPIASLPPVWAAAEESWMRYPDDRDALLDFLVENDVRDVWFLAGDYHLGAVWRVEDAGPRARYWEVLCGPGGSAPSKRLELAASSPGAHDLFFPEGRIDFATPEQCATFFTFDAQAGTVRVEVEAGDTGEVLFDRTFPPTAAS